MATKIIPVGPKEAIIQKWLEVVRTRKENTISFLVEQAILSYIKKGEFIVVGKIHFNSKEDVYEKRTSINLYFDEGSEIATWLEQIKGSSIKATAVIREIIKHSIIVVAESEEEHIPSYLEFDLLNTYQIPMLRQENNTVVSEKNDNDKKQESIEYKGDREVEKKKTIESSFYKSESSNKENINKSKNKSRSFGLTGKIIKNE